jgi:hypothetical protein
VCETVAYGGRRTIVIHGSADRMCRPCGGRATAAAVTGVRLELIDGIGHDVPPRAWPRLIAAVAAHAHLGNRLERGNGRRTDTRTAAPSDSRTATDTDTDTDTGRRPR